MSMQESPMVKRINQQCARYQHLHSGVIYRFVMEVAGVVSLESIGRGTKEVKRSDLDNPENWRRMP